MQCVPKQLPEKCYVLVALSRSGTNVGVIRRGEMGYAQAEVQGITMDAAVQIVEEMNAELGVSELEVHCMRAGSIFGWDCPAANPEMVASFLLCRV